MQKLTQEQLKELISYDPETGVFVWLVGTVNKGKITGSVNARGYLRICIKKPFTIHTGLLGYMSMAQSRELLTT